MLLLQIANTWYFRQVLKLQVFRAGEILLQ